MIFPQSNMQIIANRRSFLKREVGIKLPHSLAELAANATVHYDSESTAMRPMRRYPQANQFTIVNGSAYKVNVILDYGTRIYPCPANSMITIDKIQYDSISVENTTASTITVGQIVLMTIYEPEESIENGLHAGGRI